MQKVSLQDAKTHLSRLVDEAANGEPFIIAKDGKPMVKVVAVEPEKKPKQVRVFGFMEGEIDIPEDFDTMFADEIADMFNGKP